MRTKVFQIFGRALGKNKMPKNHTFKEANVVGRCGVEILTRKT